MKPLVIMTVYHQLYVSGEKTSKLVAFLDAELESALKNMKFSEVLAYWFEFCGKKGIELVELYDHQIKFKLIGGIELKISTSKCKPWLHISSADEVTLKNFVFEFHNFVKSKAKV